MPAALTDFLSISAAIALAAFGGEAFLRAIINGAIHLRVSQSVVATTLAAFATSTPELTVSTLAALAGQPEIGLGDALGSNVVNIALVLGLTLLLGPLSLALPLPIVRAQPNVVAPAWLAHYGLALGTPVVTLLFALNGVISRGEGLLLLVMFGFWLRHLLRTPRSSSNTAMPDPIPADEIASLSRLATSVHGLAGLVMLVLAGRLFVSGATGLATTLGIDTFSIGVLLVAIGTSLPELVTVLLARLRGHDDISLGTLIGSNLFNGLAIVGLAASLHPIHVPLAEVTLTLACGVLALLLLWTRNGQVSRLRGVALLGLYAAFVLTTLGSQYTP